MFTNEISRKQFLDEYWQKKPLLIRKSLPDFSDPISPEELAGLACENEVESRLVSVEENSWSMQSGPFDESLFTSISDKDWTLMVQAVDQWIPDVRNLMDLVDFVPDWRLDDVMVSFAEKGGGAGPHFDYYDVFIIQGQGKRLWKLGQNCDSTTSLNTESGLKILNEFSAIDEFILESGDILYIPPMRAHYGVSLDSSLSYSIGFRAPSLSEMLLDYSDELCAGLTDDIRYKDGAPTGLSPDKLHAGEIQGSQINDVRDMLVAAVDQPELITPWFGKLVTQPKYPELIAAPQPLPNSNMVAQYLEDALDIRLHPVSRLKHIQQQNMLYLFADGEAFSYIHADEILTELIQQLCCCHYTDRLSLQAFFNNRNCINLITTLFCQGTLIIFEE